MSSYLVQLEKRWQTSSHDRPCSSATSSIRLVQISTNESTILTSNCKKWSPVSASCLVVPASFSHCFSCGGPVILVNASQYSCDALVVLLDQDPVHIPLRSTQRCVQDLATELHTLTVCQKGRRDERVRVLLTQTLGSDRFACLQTVHPSRSRIWWCPTGKFSVLPLHAAGPYRKREPNFADIYISLLHPNPHRSHSC